MTIKFKTPRKEMKLNKIKGGYEGEKCSKKNA